MKFTTAAIAAATLALTSASPCTPPTTGKIADGDVFRIMTIRSGSDIQYGSFQAAQRSLLINTPKQNATCTPANTNYASFKLQNGSLILNTPSGAPAQQFFVDRSGMGQGVIQYTTGAGGIGRNSERGPFAVDDNSNLVFRAQTDIGFQACPGASMGGYSVWLQGQENPGFNKGCVPFIARAQKEDNPAACTYTS